MKVIEENKRKKRKRKEWKKKANKKENKAFETMKPWRAWNHLISESYSLTYLLKLSLFS